MNQSDSLFDVESGLFEESELAEAPQEYLGAEGEEGGLITLIYYYNTLSSRLRS